MASDPDYPAVASPDEEEQRRLLAGEMYPPVSAPEPLAAGAPVATAGYPAVEAPKPLTAGTDTAPAPQVGTPDEMGAGASRLRMTNARAAAGLSPALPQRKDYAPAEKRGIDRFGAYPSPSPASTSAPDTAPYPAVGPIPGVAPAEPLAPRTLTLADMPRIAVPSRPQWKDFDTGKHGFGQALYQILFKQPTPSEQRAERNYKAATEEFKEQQGQQKEQSEEGLRATQSERDRAETYRALHPAEQRDPVEQRGSFAEDHPDMFEDDHERNNFVLYGHEPKVATTNPNEWQLRLDAASGDEDAQAVLDKRFGEEKTLAGIRGRAGADNRASREGDAADAEQIASTILNSAGGDPDKALKLFDQHSGKITDRNQRRLGPAIRKAIRARRQINKPQSALDKIISGDVEGGLTDMQSAPQ